MRDEREEDGFEDVSYICFILHPSAFILVFVCAYFTVLTTRKSNGPLY